MVNGILSIRVEGLEEMKARLNEITGQSGEQAVYDSLDSIADFFANEMRNNAHVITGNMRASVFRGVPSGNSVEVGCSAPYAVYENARVGGIQGPHDFVDRALQATTQQADRMIRREFDILFRL